jgi:hypothetical protein
MRNYNDNDYYTDDDAFAGSRRANTEHSPWDDSRGRVPRQQSAQLRQRVERRDDRYSDDRYNDARYSDERYERDERRSARYDNRYNDRYEDRYEDDDDDNAYDDDRRMPHDNNNRTSMAKTGNFRQRHPVLMNLCYIVIATVLLLWVAMWFLDFWTFHGEERVVPDVKGQSYETAGGNVDLAGLRAVISDSVFDSYSRPGTVVEQTPIPGARIKKGGSVYLTIVAFSPKLVTVPDFYNVSVRQARSMFTGLGITEIREVPVVSEYENLVLGAKFNGVSLQPGARIPISAIVTLEVGSGMSDMTDSDEVTDTLAIDSAIEELNIE